MAETVSAQPEPAGAPETGPQQRVSGPEIVQQAREQLMALTGLKPDTVSSFGRDEQGWRVSVEMIEMKRIPDSNDVLATYDILLNDEGDLLSYQRTHRYYRAQVSD